LRGPAVLWRKRIQVEVIRERGWGGRERGCEVGWGEGGGEGGGAGRGDGMERLRRPGMWDVEFEDGV